MYCHGKKNSFSLVFPMDLFIVLTPNLLHSTRAFVRVSSYTQYHIYRFLMKVVGRDVQVKPYMVIARQNGGIISSLYISYTAGNCLGFRCLYMGVCVVAIYTSIRLKFKQYNLISSDLIDMDILALVTNVHSGRQIHITVR